MKDITLAITAGVTAASNAANVTFLNGVAQGVGAGQRVGRMIRMKSLLLRWMASFAPTTAGASALRLLVVYDRSSNGAAAAATDILVANTIAAPMNLGNASRFLTLIDELVPCLGGSTPAVAISRFIVLDDLPVEYSGTGATTASIATGAIRMFVWQDGNIITADPTVTAYSRIRFEDN